MKTITLGLLGAALVTAMAVGCGDDDDDAQLTGGSGGVGGGAGAASGTGGVGGTAGTPAAGTGGAGGTAGQPIGTVTVLASFDAALGELPEGLAVDGSGTPYVGFAPTAEIVELRPDGSSRSALAKLPAPPPDGQGFMTGLALDGAGNLYAALASFKADVAAPGIYRVPSPRGGGAGAAGAAGASGAGGEGGRGGDPVKVTTPFASNAGMLLPNGIAIDDAAKFGYVTDSASGAVYRFSLEAAGEATPWLASNELLKGGTTLCDGTPALLDVGANGLVLAGNTFFIANSNKGTVLTVTRDASGNAGTPTVFANDCAQLKGIDGLSPDGSGGLYAAINSQNKIVRIGRDGAISVLAQGGELDFPASLALQGNSLYVTNFAFTTPAATAKAGLLRIEVQSR